MFNFICKRNFLIVIIIMVFQNLIILTLMINTFSSLLIIKIFINDIFDKYKRYDVLTERKKKYCCGYYKILSLKPFK